jgi:membrane protease YdiL (CAAX protease family)
MKRNDLFQTFGLCKGSVSPSQLLWYLPLAALISNNLWFGLRWNLPLHETLFYIASMICVGFVEEVIFRGLLFNAMCKDGLKSAVIVSSLTFGIGHIVNLFNGSGAQLLSNLCQVGYAAAVGFLFVILFLKTGSLIPCIVTHSAVNALSVFANEGSITVTQEIFSAIAIALIALAYSVYLLKKLPK